mmetsp:Transcript_37655/g.60416  ORF Transcript_37655/g.60416 Transcript_37655/m.60416 type:complete len:214 (+) Transcript_37655:91-732(+)
MEIYQTSFRTNDNNHTTEEANLSSSPREWDDSLDGRCCTSESNISHMSTIFMRKRDENSSSSNGDAGISRIGLNEGVEFEWNIDPRKGSLHITGALETTTTLTNQNDLEVEVLTDMKEKKLIVKATRPCCCCCFHDKKDHQNQKLQSSSSPLSTSSILREFQISNDFNLRSTEVRFKHGILSIMVILGGSIVAVYQEVFCAPSIRVIYPDIGY